MSALIITIAAALGHNLGPEEFRQALDLERGLQSTIAGQPIALDSETVAAARLHVRSEGPAEPARLEQALAKTRDAHGALLAEQARLKSRIATVEQEMLHGRLRTDRELRVLRLRCGERDAAPLPTPSLAPPQKDPEPKPVSWRVRLGRWVLTLSAN